MWWTVFIRLLPKATRTRTDAANHLRTLSLGTQDFVSVSTRFFIHVPTPTGYTPWLTLIWLLNKMILLWDWSVLWLYSDKIWLQCTKHIHKKFWFRQIVPWTFNDSVQYVTQTLHQKTSDAVQLSILLCLRKCNLHVHVSLNSSFAISLDIAIM